MSLEDEIKFGFSEAVDLAGEYFTLLACGGLFCGVFAGDSADVDFDNLQGHNAEITNSVTVAKSSFTLGAPSVDQVLMRLDGSKYNITAIESQDGSTWDFTLKKING